MKFTIPSIATLSLAIALSILPQTSSAAPEERTREVFIEKLKSLRSDLDLSSDQKDKIRSIIKSHQANLKAQWSSGKAARESMKKANLNHGPDSAETRAAADAIGTIARNRSLLLAKIATEVRPVLNPEQLEKFEKARLEFDSLIETKLDSAR
jgi:Spy/CpxP family protein refolding chaperone